jgi:cyclophilin family peptidyl-prolyl cis-trans isomerase
MAPPSERNNNRWLWIAGGVAAVLALIVLVYIYTLGNNPGGGAGASTAPTAVAGRTFLPPDATPLASPPAAPSGDGTTATIQTDLGTIVFELYNQSAPVASQNFINLANAGFYNGLTFHRIVPDFVIQGGDPAGDGSGGPGYDIQDEPVVGEYGRGTVAMARTQAPDSAGSQFFIVVSDNAKKALDSFRTYVIFGNVLTGMDVVDDIVSQPNSGSPNNAALDPTVMTSVTIQPPSALPSSSPAPSATSPATSLPPATLPASPSLPPSPSGS